MIKSITFLAICTFSGQALAQTQASAAPTAASHFQQGLAAEKSGNAAAAKEHYSQALKLDPKHADARYSLGQLKLTSPAIAARGREAKFGAVMIPVFQLDQATLPEALEALTVIVEKQSKEEVTPNFVIEDPKNLLVDRKISMNLKNMPAKAVMKYLMDQSGAKPRYDEHAIVVVVR